MTLDSSVEEKLFDDDDSAGVVNVDSRALRSDGEDTVTGSVDSNVAAVTLFSFNVNESHFPLRVASLAPSDILYAFMLRSPPIDLEMSWTTRMALPLPVTFSTAASSSMATRVAKPPLCVDR